MILSFNIEYRTNWGEEVRIAGLSPESVPLHTTDGIYWTAELEFEVPNEGLTIHYNYQIEQNGTVFPDVFSCPVPPRRNIESMTAGRIFPSNYAFTVLLLQKPCWHILKGKKFHKVTKKGWLSRLMLRVSTRITAWQSAAIKRH